MGFENQMTSEQKSGPLVFAIKKLAPHMVKDLQKIPEDKLQEGMRGIARAIIEACDGPAPQLQVVGDGD